MATVVVTTVIGTVVDTDALLKTIAFSLAAGVGVTLAFSVAIYGAARFADLRRADRVAAATAAIVLAAVGLLVCAAAVTAGIVVMLQK